MNTTLNINHVRLNNRAVVLIRSFIIELEKRSQIRLHLYDEDILPKLKFVAFRAKREIYISLYQALLAELPRANRKALINCNILKYSWAAELENRLAGAKSIKI